MESASGLNTLFSNGQALGVSATFNGRVSKLDVIGSALTDLKDDLLNLSQNGNTYNINGITYDDGSNVANAVGELVKVARVEGRS